jgi:hypothetical protein
MQEDVLRRIFINYLHYNVGLSIDEASVAFEGKKTSIYEVIDLVGEKFMTELFKKINNYEEK